MKAICRIVIISIVVVCIPKIVFSQYLRGIIDQQLNSLGLPYLADHVVDVDKSIGLVGGKVVEGEISDPYETLKGSLLFTAYNPSVQGPDTADWIVGVSKNGSIIWRSNNLGNIRSAEIYGALDLNLDGKVDIIVEEEERTLLYSASYLQIFSWDGANGTDITSEEIDPQTENSQIFGGYHSYDISDLDGDGIMEIRSYPGPREDTINVHSWGWNGQKYGHWSNTPTLPFTSWLPAKNASANVYCRVIQQDTVYRYEYQVQSKSESKRRIENVHFPVKAKTKGYTFDSWHASGGDFFPIVSWDMIGLDYRNMIQKGEKKAGFTMTSKGLPAINSYYVQSEHGLVEYDYDLNDLRDDIINNSTSGLTISPQAPPSPFIPLTFLDTLTGYTNQSRTLGWIKDSLTAVKYLGYFSTAKTELQQNDTATAKSTLRQVLSDVDVDSTSHLTSEAYALLRFNTEYLIPRIVPLDTLRIPSQYATIQAAINAADSGRVILVSAGTYSEQDSINNKKSLKLIAVDTSVTIQGVTISNSSNITVKGFKIYASGTSQDAVQLTGAQNTNITIEANDIQYSSKHGITIGQNNDNINIVNNVIANNDQNGINFATGATGTQYIVNNTIVKNGHCGIEAVGPQKLLIVNNIIIYDTLAGRSGERLISGAGITYIMQKNNLVLRRQNGVLQSNYHLVPGSIAIDKGTTNFAPLPTKDKDGNSRISGTTIDVGAYEYQQ
jgi:hypothetical protein